MPNLTAHIAAKIFLIAYATTAFRRQRRFTVVSTTALTFGFSLLLARLTLRLAYATLVRRTRGLYSRGL
jgi:hypothetical protein